MGSVFKYEYEYCTSPGHVWTGHRGDPRGGSQYRMGEKAYSILVNPGPSLQNTSNVSYASESAMLHPLIHHRAKQGNKHCLNTPWQYAYPSHFPKRVIFKLHRPSAQLLFGVRKNSNNLSVFLVYFK